MNDNDTIFKTLAHVLKAEAEKHGLLEEPVVIRCRPKTVEEAIGRPEDRDYPIIKGKECLVEATFKGARGQAFTDEYGNTTLTLQSLVSEIPRTNRKRAEFIAALNAVWLHLGLCEGTVHCRDEEPRACAEDLATRIDKGMNVLLVGFQPRMAEFLSRDNPMMILDLDEDNIGKTKFGCAVCGPEDTEKGIEWCHLILATGSTIVNGTLPRFLSAGKPVIFYGVTIAAAAKILHLDRYCFCGH